VDIVLGVSMTPTTVRMALVEGEKADGLTVDHDVFDVGTIDDSADSANTSAPEQVISAILGTQQSAVAGGHRLVATGVTWSDYVEAATLRAELANRGIDDVALVSELHAAGALAQAAGRAVGYDTTALLFVDSDTATLSVVEVGDASIVKVLSRSLHADDAMTVLTEMVTSLEAQDARPQGVFVVGSGVDVASVKEHLEGLVGVPVSAPEDAAMALARGAALAAAGAPRFEATTVGLAYSQDPDGAISPAFAATELGPVSAPVIDGHAMIPEEDRRPFLLVGSTLTTIFVIGVVALVISLAVSIRPTANQRPNPHQSIVVPSAAAPAPPAPEQLPAAPAVQPAPETIPPPVPVVQQAPAVSPPQAVVAPPPVPAAAPAAPPPAAEVAPPVAAPEAPPVYVPPPAYQPPAYVPAPGVQIPPLVPRRWYPRHEEPPWGDDQPQGPPWAPQGPPWQQPRGPVILQPPFAPSGPRNPFWPF
jgi:hypothetical protein